MVYYIYVRKKTNKICKESSWLDTTAYPQETLEHRKVKDVNGEKVYTDRSGTKAAISLRYACTCLFQTSL